MAGTSIDMSKVKQLLQLKQSGMSESDPDMPALV